MKNKQRKAVSVGMAAVWCFTACVSAFGAAEPVAVDLTGAPKTVSVSPAAVSIAATPAAEKPAVSVSQPATSVQFLSSASPLSAVSAKSNTAAPAVPAGWERAKSNPNYAFTVRPMDANCEGIGCSKELVLMDLRTGRQQNVTAISGNAEKPFYDVTPEQTMGGPLMILSIQNPSAYQQGLQDFLLVFVRLNAQWSTGIQEYAVKRGSVQSVLLNSEGDLEIKYQLVYPDDTVLESFYKVSAADFRTKEHRLGLIRAGSNFVSEPVSQMAVFLTHDGLSFFDASKGFSQMSVIKRIPPGADDIGQPLNVNLLTGLRVNGRRYIFVEFKARQSDSSVLNVIVMMDDSGNWFHAKGNSPTVRIDGAIATFTGAPWPQVNLMRFEFLPILSGNRPWTATPSNQDYAFTLMEGTGSDFTASVLTLMNLKTGQMTNIFESLHAPRFPINGAIVGYCDVSPDGSSVMFSYQPKADTEKYVTVVRSIVNPQESLTLEGRLIRVRSNANGQAHLVVDRNGTQVVVIIDLAAKKVVGELAPRTYEAILKHYQGVFPPSAKITAVRKNFDRWGNGSWEVSVSFPATKDPKAVQTQTFQGFEIRSQILWMQVTEKNFRSQALIMSWYFFNYRNDVVFAYSLVWTGWYWRFALIR